MKDRLLATATYLFHFSMKDQFFIEVIELLKKESKCVSRKVAALIVKDGRIISTGYNGTLSRTPNCCDFFDADSFDREAHHAWSLKNEIHAEQNAIAVAAKNGISLDGCTCYSSLQPCNTCLLLLAQTGIKRIVYVEPYDKSDYHQDILTALKTLNVELVKYEK